MTALVIEMLSAVSSNRSPIWIISMVCPTNVVKRSAVPWPVFATLLNAILTTVPLASDSLPMSVYCVDCREWRDIMPYHLQYCHNAMCRMPICVWQRHRNDERPDGYLSFF
ncbi:hypothetical protein L596_010928 [Steinernema carpocapsae]|uniref:TAZ-type domain-containing protein n=1 Tax=Steinernema carpocapsae TaxID=34508 RepID=A0A4V6A719_STECR|nr:hypothetical protein L596_010928 [Steinernema carpocapsae]